MPLLHTFLSVICLLTSALTDMGLSSIGFTFLFLPLCVSSRPQSFQLEMKRLQAALEVSLGYDLDSVDDSEAKTKSNQSDLVQSMALTCPPPVASFLRFE